MKILNKIKLFLNKHKSVVIFVFLFVIVFSIVQLGYAQDTNVINKADLQTSGGGILGGMLDKLLIGLAWIVYYISVFLGIISTFLIGLLIWVAKWNHFIDVEAVNQGWTIVRDFCNMFFVLILLVIAFSTILRREQYSAKQLLPKLVLAAILINFSKLIAGVFIDFSQVLMMTFLNQISAADLVDSLNIKAMLSFTGEGKKIDGFVVLMSALASLVVLIIVGILSLVMLAMLVVRIVMLWVYIIFAPVAFLGQAFPPLNKYAQQWWTEFTTHVTSGPIIAFFLWLAITTAQSSANKGMENNTPTAISGDIQLAIFQKMDVFFTYIITVALLMAGLIMAQKMGGAAGAIAGKGIAGIKGGGKWAGRKFSGYGAVADTLSKYSSMRKSAKDQKATLRAESLAGGIGAVKQKFGKGLSKAGGGIKTAFQLNRGKNKANRLREEVKKDKNELDESKDKTKEFKTAIKGKKDFTKDGTKYSYSNIANKWEARKAGHTTRSITEAEAKQELDDDIKSQESSITNKKVEIKEAEDRQKLTDRRTKIGLGVAGAGLGLATGGLGLVGLGLAAAGGVAGGLGVPKVAKGIKDAGKTDLGLASNYRAKQINDEKDKIKLESDDQVLATMDDASQDAFTRSAAAMEAMSRKLLDLEGAKEKTEYIKKNMGGETTDKNGNKNWKDKRIGGQVDAILEKNYTGATNTFDGLDKDTNKQRTVRDRYENGTYTMKDMDTKSLDASIDQLADGMKTGTFTKQFKDLNDNKKDSIKQSLKKSGTKKAKEKLAHVTNIDEAFDNNADKASFVSSLSVKQIQDVVQEGDKDKVEALKQFVSKDASKFSDAVQKQVTGATGVGKEIKSAFEIA